MLGKRQGMYSHTDYYGDSLVNISLKEPMKIEVRVYVHIL